MFFAISFKIFIWKYGSSFFCISIINPILFYSWFTVVPFFRVITSNLFKILTSFRHVNFNIFRKLFSLGSNCATGIVRYRPLHNKTKICLALKYISNIYIIIKGGFGRVVKVLYNIPWSSCVFGIKSRMWTGKGSFSGAENGRKTTGLRA